MNIHFILHSPVYTSKLIAWIKSISNEPAVFIELASFRELYIYQKDTKKKRSFFQAKRWLKKANIHRAFYHYLSPQMVLLMHNIPVKYSCWFVWGADFYDLVFHRNDYLSDHAKKHHRASFFADFIAKKYSLSFIKNLNAIAANQQDYEEIKRQLNPPSKHYLLDSLFPVKISDQLDLQGSKILLGNSDDVFNNHVLGFSFLNSIEQNLKCIVPLSGAKNKYVQEIKKRAKLSKHNIHCIDDFIPIDAFNKLMKEVNTVVFPHYRQQGLGTILPLLLNGRKVFLSEKNPLYRLFKSWEVLVFVLENINQYDITKPLSKEEKIQNKTALLNVLNETRIKKQWLDILHT